MADFILGILATALAVIVVFVIGLVFGAGFTIAAAYVLR